MIWHRARIYIRQAWSAQKEKVLAGSISATVAKKLFVRDFGDDPHVYTFQGMELEVVKTPPRVT